MKEKIALILRELNLNEWLRINDNLDAILNKVRLFSKWMITTEPQEEEEVAV